MTTVSPPARPNLNDQIERARRELLSPWPKLSFRLVASIVITIAVIYWAMVGSRFSVQDLVTGMPMIWNLIVRMFPIRMPMTEVDLVIPFVGSFDVSVPELLPAIFETLQMAIIGTLGGILLSVPFAILAARNTTPHPLVYQVTRFLLNANRAIPDLIFALIFVAAVGLGPFGGVLALMIGGIGTKGKLFAEAIEAIDPQQVQAVRATGANTFQTFIYAVLPQALPVTASYSLLAFESNVRSATILGIVGAGGVGFVLSKYMALFQYRELLGALILIIILVTILDRISDALRKRII
ncbi:MAG: phosphonate ABC transporter, permease protein PhnE [Dehalococcoidia bacterium]|nr:phosphonate ABC transporter, permease protein PhnE [Dehalococcoidia bacterium]